MYGTSYHSVSTFSFMPIVIVLFFYYLITTIDHAANAAIVIMTENYWFACF